MWIIDEQQLGVLSRPLSSLKTILQKIDVSVQLLQYCGLLIENVSLV